MRGTGVYPASFATSAQELRLSPVSTLGVRDTIFHPLGCPLVHGRLVGTFHDVEQLHDYTNHTRAGAHTASTTFSNGITHAPLRTLCVALVWSVHYACIPGMSDETMTICFGVATQGQ